MKTHIKLYKAKKKWMTALVVSGAAVTLGIGVDQANPSVSAQSLQTQTQTQTTSDQQQSTVNISHLENSIKLGNVKLFESGGSHNISGYTPYSLGILSKDVNAGQTLVDAIKAGSHEYNQTYVDKLAANIDYDSNHMQRRVNVSGLEAAVNQATSYLKTKGVYTQSSLANLQKTVSEGDTIIQNAKYETETWIKTYYQVDADSATQKIKAAISGLQKVSTVNPTTPTNPANPNPGKAPSSGSQSSNSSSTMSASTSSTSTNIGQSMNTQNASGKTANTGQSMNTQNASGKTTNMEQATTGKAKSGELPNTATKQNNITPAVIGLSVIGTGSLIGGVYLNKKHKHS